MPSPDDWGYDVSDYTGVHPELGTLADLDELIAQAGRRAHYSLAGVRTATVTEPGRCPQSPRRCPAWDPAQVRVVTGKMSGMARTTSGSRCKAILIFPPLRSCSRNLPRDALIRNVPRRRQVPPRAL